MNIEKSVSERLRNILRKYFDHDVVYISHERRSEAEAAIKSLILESLPDKKSGPIGNSLGINPGMAEGYNAAIEECANLFDPNEWMAKEIRALRRK